MILNKSIWESKDIKAFQTYLKTFQNKEKEAWSRKILNTKLELLCLQTKTLDMIVQEIFKGNYQSFLDLMIFDNYESIAIYGKLLSNINDFSIMHHYLDIYKDQMENWAHVDLLSFQINSSNQNSFINLSDEYINSNHEFIRRLGLMILFQMVKDQGVLPVIFISLKKLRDEKAYYVIMMAGWLLSECIIKYQDRTLSFIQNNLDLNIKIVNKAIQKCRESRRVSKLLKDELLVYKRSNFQ